MKIIDKLKGAKNAMRCYREGLELLEAQKTDIKDYDDQFLIESKDLVWSFPFVARAIKKRQTKLILLEPQKAEVFCGTQGDYINREFCQSKNIPVTPFPTQGGALACNKGDLLIVYVRPLKGFRLLDYLKPKIIEYLKSAGFENVTTPNNDIEVDGKKLSGSSTAVKMGVVIESIFINGVNNKTLIDAIGHKGKKREVTSLTDLGIDLKKFRKWLVETVKAAETNE